MATGKSQYPNSDANSAIATERELIVKNLQANCSSVPILVILRLSGTDRRNARWYDAKDQLISKRDDAMHATCAMSAEIELGKIIRKFRY